MQFSLPQLHEAIAAAVPDREALVFRDKRFTFAQLTDRTRCLANFFLSRGITIHQQRKNLDNWESGQDHVALLMLNGNEYLESTLGALKAQAVPFNVNFRYVEKELLYVLNNANAKAIVYHSQFAPRLSAILKDLSHPATLIQVKDGSGIELLPGALDYDDLIASSSSSKPNVVWSPDDLYMLYTGGTTGMPKGVLWRQGDLITSALGGKNSDGSVIDCIDTFTERATGGRRHRFLTTPPFMHGASHWLAFNAWHGGNTVIVQNNVEKLDPPDVLSVIEKERATALMLVGDAFGRPILEEIQRGNYDLSCIKIIMNNGAILNHPVKVALLEMLPAAKIVDNMGASETGSQGVKISTLEGITSKNSADATNFKLSADNVVLSEDLQKVLEKGHDRTGWLAKKVHVPLGYLDDREKTQSTFPEVDGQRYAVPGDKVQLKEDGNILFFGRDSGTINSGGEKIFAEEVERALKYHPSVFDAVVAGRPSERWGNEVVAVVQLRKSSPFDKNSILDECGKHIAGYKLPKAFSIVATIKRSPSGKADYRWAKLEAEKAS